MQHFLSPHSQAIWLVLPCAGIGQRLGADIPKQYLQLQGQTIVEHSIQAFADRDDITGIVLAVAANDSWLKGLPLVGKWQDKIHIVEGGQERADSVKNALDYLQRQDLCQADAWVCVHDAARPCIKQTDVDKLFTALDTTYVQEHGALLALPSFNTLKQTSSHRDVLSSEATIDRSSVWQALTPQIFPLEKLSKALQTAEQQGLSVTDDASAMELSGFSPLLVEGSAQNIKVTTVEDLSLAEFYLSKYRELVS